MTQFSELGLSENLLKALPELGIETPTPIQEQAIPELMKANVDLIGLAQTGTGKTAAFGLPLLEKIDTSFHATQGLILAPTRELGQQIAAQLQAFAKYMPKINVLAVYGGAAITNQMRDLKKNPQIIIATPGRLIDLINRKAVKLKDIDFLVLDEADEMLNMGFQEDLDIILSHTPAEKNTWLFSATMPREIKKIVKKYMTNQVEITVSAENSVNENIEHQYVVVGARDKAETLTRFLDGNQDMKGIVFCRTKRDTQALAEMLLQNDYKADAIHGDLSQAQRDRVMKRFKAHQLQVLCATDVAARGIDVNDLTHVIHYSLPDDFSYYTHRSGRTARAGKKGISLSIVTKGEFRRIGSLQRQLKITFNKALVPKVEDIQKSKIGQWINKIKEVEKPAVQEDVWKIVVDAFEEVSKEELLAKLLDLELQKMKRSSGSKDLNVSEDGGGRGRGRDGDRRRDRDRSGRDRRGGRDGDRRDRSSKSFDGERRSHRDGGNDRRRGQFGSERNERSRDGDTGNRRRKENENSGDVERYFINIGEKDGFDKKDLVEFISEVSKVDRKSIGDVKLLNKQAYFNVDKDSSKNMSSKFKGLELDGRDIRVNRDE